MKNRKQFGAEERTTPLPILHDKPGTRKIVVNKILIILTISFWILYIVSTIIQDFFLGKGNYTFTLEALLYSVIVTFLTFSALMYLIARQGALIRFKNHKRVPRKQIDSYFAKHNPLITTLIPSYAEEPSVIKKTILSAALQEYPSKRVVLLIDDNPNPKIGSQVEEKLNKTRELISEINNDLKFPSDKFNIAYENVCKTLINRNFVTIRDINKLVDQYNWAIHWLNSYADKFKIEDHVDIFFIEQVILAQSKELSKIVDALHLCVKNNKENINPEEFSKDRLIQHYLKLKWIFNCEVSYFERKKYISLSHEPNKAMNLNSYISLMGGKYRFNETKNGTELLKVANNEKYDMDVPDSEYLLTLDADSILLREYCLRLVYLLESPENKKIAVAQTPYSSFRGAGTRIERLAGATTDIQHILHQGLTQYDATFWVGANAVIRKVALEDIVETETDGKYTFKKYVQDRTVIEDTESSMDITICGWKLYNYPERLSYSATPPDFGSLVIQRRRWANGGLIILPKLFLKIGKMKDSGNNKVSLAEFLLRLNYMASITWASFSLIFILFFPFYNTLLSPLVMLAALPYFYAMSEDLKYCGYKRSDVFRIYGFNLILLPVNFAGTVKSFQQLLTNEKIPFARTPKVKNRTITQSIFILVPLFIIFYSLFVAYREYYLGNIGDTITALFNVFLASWAVFSYIGVINLINDLIFNFSRWFIVEKKVVVKSDTSINCENEIENYESSWIDIIDEGDINGTIFERKIDSKHLNFGRK